VVQGTNYLYKHHSIHIPLSPLVANLLLSPLALVLYE